MAVVHGGRKQPPRDSCGSGCFVPIRRLLQNGSSSLSGSTRNLRGSSSAKELRSSNGKKELTGSSCRIRQGAWAAQSVATLTPLGVGQPGPRAPRLDFTKAHQCRISAAMHHDEDDEEERMLLREEESDDLSTVDIDSVRARLSASMDGTPRGLKDAGRMVLVPLGRPPFADGIGEDEIPGGTYSNDAFGHEMEKIAEEHPSMVVQPDAVRGVSTVEESALEHEPSTLEESALPQMVSQKAVRVHPGFTEHTYRMVFPFEEHFAPHTPHLLTIQPSGTVENDKVLEPKKEKGLITFSYPQNISDEAAALPVPLHQDGNTDGSSAIDGKGRNLCDTAFVWRRGDGTNALVQTWSTNLNETFRKDFEISEGTNPDSTKFLPQAVSEFQEAMARLFGPAADGCPLWFCHKQLVSASPAVVGFSEDVLAYVSERPELMRELSIASIDIEGLGFVADGTNGNGEKFEKHFRVTPGEECVLYRKTGWSTMGCSKPLRQFICDAKLHELPNVLASTVFEETPQEALQEVPQEAPQEAPQEVPQEAPQEAPREALQEEAPQASSQEPPQEYCRRHRKRHHRHLHVSHRRSHH